MSKSSLAAKKPEISKASPKKRKRVRDVKSLKPVKKAKSKTTGEDGEDGSYMGWCSWTPAKGYSARTKDGEIPMFDEGGHRAVEVVLMATAACLNFFMVEYVRQRNLDVTDIQVSCDGEIIMRPERVKRITTRVAVDGKLTNEEIKKMVHICEGACKVMNTFKHKPECEVVLLNSTGEFST